MFKRFTCMILSFVLLLALVPAGAIEASAATNATSDKAITILKKVHQFRNTCYTTAGKIGYGTPCTESGKHGAGSSHIIREEDADAALRAELKKLDTVVNTFASNNGISLSQHKHDALVLFTFRNGQSWMNGADDLRSAVIHGTKGNAFINQMVNWKGETEPEYRLILANMYLSNEYASARPSKYVKVTYNANGGKVDSLQPGNASYYYDTTLSESALLVPTNGEYRFAGWFLADGTLAKKIVGDANGNMNVTARWQAKTTTPTNPEYYDLWMKASGLYNTTLYEKVNENAMKAVDGGIHANYRYVDEKGIEWLRISYAEKYDGKAKGTLNPAKWVKWRSIMPGSADTDSSGSGGGGGMWVPVTVTNSYINVRERANIFSTQIGTVYAGEKYWVAATEENTGYLWGLIYGDKGEVGYVALMYTDYDEVIAGNAVSNTPATPVDTVIAKAIVEVKGYVNVRSGAGTGNSIVSSLRDGAEVDIYETKYVNGQQWGRCKAGWFSLAYAKLSNYKDNYDATDIGFVSYLFNGKLTDVGELKQEKGNAKTPFDVTTLGKDDPKPEAGKTIRISNITVHTDGTTWGKAYYNKVFWGWIKVSASDGTLNSNVEFETIKFTTVAETAVRDDHKNGAKRIDVLNVGTEFDVKKIVADKDTIWGYASDLKPNLTNTGTDITYSGWVNLSLKYVSRNGAKVEEPKNDSGDKTACTLGTVIDCVEVNMRSKASIYGTKVGTLPVGTVVEIIDGPVNGTRRTGWYQLNINLANGKSCWVRGDYLDVRQGTRGEVTYGKQATTSPDGTEAATGRGIVANTYGGVNVRTAPGTANTQLTKLLPGTEVSILSVTYHGQTKWGKITLDDGRTGWLCMDYIAMMDYDDLPTTPSATVTEKAVYTGHTQITTTTTITADKLKAEKAIVYKDSKDWIIVYASADSESDIVRYMEVGDAVTIHELLTATEYKDVETEDSDLGSKTETKTSYWARINDGYIKLPQYTVALDALDENTYTVTGTDLLKVRNGAANSERLEFDLKKGDQVKVTNLEIIQANVWGQIDHNDTPAGKEAWISLAYCTPGAIDTSTPEKPENGSTDSGIPVEGTILSQGNTGKGNYMGTIIGQYPKVNVRKDASTNAEVVTELNKGASVTISETKLVDGRSWGYCGTGWINLVYVDLTPVGITAIDAKVIATDNTLCYESSETGAKVVGSYASRAVVNIYEEINGMYRTDMGWVAKNNFL